MLWYLKPWDGVKSLRGEGAGGVHDEAKSTPAFTIGVGEEEATSAGDRVSCQGDKRENKGWGRESSSHISQESGVI